MELFEFCDLKTTIFEMVFLFIIISSFLGMGRETEKQKETHLHTDVGMHFRIGTERLPVTVKSRTGTGNKTQPFLTWLASIQFEPSKLSVKSALIGSWIQEMEPEPVLSACMPQCGIQLC